MIKSLRFQILEYLHQYNATMNTIDIKPGFIEKLDTVKKRREFKAELDYMISDGLITGGPYDFLNWELVSGLYPLDNKTINAKLTYKGKASIQSESDPNYVSNLAEEENLISEYDELVPVSPARAGSYNAQGTVLSYLIVQDTTLKPQSIDKPVFNNNAATTARPAQATVTPKPSIHLTDHDPLLALGQISLQTTRIQKAKTPVLKYLLLAALGGAVLMLLVLIYLLTKSRY